MAGKLFSIISRNIVSKYNFIFILFTAFYLLFSFKLDAQPVDSDIIINEEAYTQAFLHCTIDEKYFAKYAVEARSSLMEMKDNIFCKLHVPLGLRNSLSEFLKNYPDLLLEFNYSKESSIPILFNFYINGVKISSSRQFFEHTITDEAPFSFVFKLNPSEITKNEADLNLAYLKLLTNIKYAYSTIYIEANIAPKNLESKNYIRLATGSFSLRLDPTKQEEIKNNIAK
jgi:hypothetical protein